jgi:CubicO group peptidase (beta-lactamase class C family)
MSAEGIRWGWLFSAVLFGVCTLGVARARPVVMPISPASIDGTVARAMQAFQVPGMAVGIVKDGKLVYAKGYGVREYGQPEAVDPDTVFQIGSNTKAFTAAALAMLVDAGKLHWDDKVTQYLPDFQMYDPYVTREFTVRDLLTHRSGLGLGAGDLMFYPTTDFTRAQIIHGVRYLKPVSSFRSQFAYDNLLYMVAGELIPAITGDSWEQFVQRHILQPLHMGGCGANRELVKDRSNLASPHVVVDGKLTPIPVEDLTVVGGAGTINCSVNSMAKWLETQLNRGTTPDGVRLFSSDRSAEMWSINTVQPLDADLASLTRTHFLGYGLGWDISDEFGRERVAHTGGVPGTVTWVSMVPELKLGVLVFTNQQEAAAMEAVGHQILDAYLGAPHRDWVAIAVAYRDKRQAEAAAVEGEAAKVAKAAGSPTLPLSAYVGHYDDAWRGEATVRLEGDKLVLKFGHTRELEGPLAPYSGNVFVVRWNERALRADAFVRFEQGFGVGVEGMTLRAVSPATDFSFDFQDLEFRKVGECGGR